MWNDTKMWINEKVEENCTPGNNTVNREATNNNKSPSIILLQDFVHLGDFVNYAHLPIFFRKIVLIGAQVEIASIYSRLF